MPDITLGELLSETGGSVKTGPFGTTLKAAEYSKVGSPVISVGEVGYGFVQLHERTPRVPETVIERLPEYVLRSGDIVFGRKGAVDRSAWLRAHEDGYFLGSDGIRVRVGRGADSRFIAYQLQSQSVREWLIQHAAGTTMASLNQPTLERVPLRVPPLKEQQAIAEVLGALDDKIAANTRLVTTARALMASQYEAAVEHGYTDTPLEQIAMFHNRRRVPLSSKQRDERIGTTPYYGATGVFGYVDEALFDEVLVLVGEDGSVVRPDGRPVVQYIWGPAWVNNHAHVITGVGVSTEVLRLAVQRANVIPIVTGAVQPKISMGNLKRLELEVPTAEGLSQLEPLVAELSAIERARTQESRTLAKLRDTLLPQLMSGKIKVKDAERVVEGVV